MACPMSQAFRIFVKVGYDKISTIKGTGSPVEIYRIGTGIKLSF